MSAFAQPALLATALMVVPCLAQAETVTFAQAQVGSVPKGFEIALTGEGEPGLWGIVNDTEAGGGRALEQRTPDPTDYHFPLAIYEPVVTRNVEASVRFKTLYGKVDQAGGVAIRLIDPNNYYVARANALEDNVRFYRVVAGKREQIASADTRVIPGDWHTLTLRAERERFTVSFDGRELFTTTDWTFGGEGRVALWTKADSITRFDRLEIKPLSE